MEHLKGWLAAIGFFIIILISSWSMGKFEQIRERRNEEIFPPEN